ncbi:MAG: hypothetical protein RLZZ480_163 [Candidatus Parcubacteria bacterium]|jgi:chromosome segregation ATPase
MSDKNEGKGFLGGLGDIFIKPVDETSEGSAPAAAPALSPQPTLISTIAAGATAPVATSSSSSARALELLKAAQEKVPNDNAQFKLDAAMQSIAALEPDNIKRRAMATAMLASQGISPEKIAEDEKHAREIMAKYLREMSGGLATKLASDVTSVRERAGGLRQQSADLTQQIEQLNSQAAELDKSASDAESELNALNADIQSALNLINS